MAFERIITILLINSAIGLDIIPIENPLLPIKLGNAHLNYNKHTFLYYFELDLLEKHIDTIREDIDTLKDTAHNINYEITSIMR